MSLESVSSTWDAITFWLAVAGTVVLFLGGVSSIAARRYARRLASEKEQQSQSERAAHERALASLRVDLAQAIAHGEEAGRAAADANARAAEANARAAEAGLQTEKLRTRFTRSFTPYQQETMIKLLGAYSQYAEAEVLETDWRDPELSSLASQIISVLHRAKWTTERNIYDKNGDPLMGVLIQYSASDFGANNIALGLSDVLRRHGGLMVEGPEPTSLQHKKRSRIVIQLTVGRR
jgi:hypothetical protein